RARSVEVQRGLCGSELYGKGEKKQGGDPMHVQFSVFDDQWGGGDVRAMDDPADVGSAADRATVRIGSIPKDRVLPARKVAAVHSGDQAATCIVDLDQHLTGRLQFKTDPDLT